MSLLVFLSPIVLLSFVSASVQMVELCSVVLGSINVIQGGHEHTQFQQQMENNYVIRVIQNSPLDTDWQR